jgi:hypothetical protein
MNVSRSHAFLPAHVHNHPRNIAQVLSRSRVRRWGLLGVGVGFSSLWFRVVNSILNTDLMNEFMISKLLRRQRRRWPNYTPLSAHMGAGIA